LKSFIFSILQRFFSFFRVDDILEPEQEDTDWTRRVNSGFDRLFKLSRSIEESGDFDDYKIKTEDLRSNSNRGNK
jgi:hypothetical protein